MSADRRVNLQIETFWRKFFPEFIPAAKIGFVFLICLSVACKLPELSRCKAKRLVVLLLNFKALHLFLFDREGRGTANKAVLRPALWFSEQKSGCLLCRAEGIMNKLRPSLVWSSLFITGWLATNLYAASVGP